MTPKDLEIISAWNRIIKENPSLSILLNKGEKSHQMESFCSDLIKEAARINLKKKMEKDRPFPEIRIRHNIRYHAIPLENELEPFLYALSSPDPHANKLPQQVRDTLTHIKNPVLIKVYVSVHCPFCPKVVRECLSMAVANPLINIIIIDGVIFPDMAAEDSIRSVPTIILDDQFRWTGNVNIEEIANMAISRDPVTLRADSLIQIIQDGRASDLAKMMVDSNTIFPSFIDLLVHDKWSVRLGAMVCFEHIAEKSLELSSRVITLLWDLFPDLNDQIKGDMLYLMGESHNPEATSKLKVVINGEYASDLKEAAQEAIDTIENVLDV